MVTVGVLYPENEFIYSIQTMSIYNCFVSRCLGRSVPGFGGRVWVYIMILVYHDIYHDASIS